MPGECHRPSDRRRQRYRRHVRRPRPCRCRCKTEGEVGGGGASGGRRLAANADGPASRHEIGGCWPAAAPGCVLLMLLQARAVVAIVIRSTFIMIVCVLCLCFRRRLQR
jgi:hypothetical protein